MLLQRADVNRAGNSLGQIKKLSGRDANRYTADNSSVYIQESWICCRSEKKKSMFLASACINECRSLAGDASEFAPLIK